MKPGKIIVDCDAGIDDALALLILIAAHKINKIEIKAITCVYGNTSLVNVIKNVFRILNVSGNTDIPVFKGADCPLLTIPDTEKSAEDFHGEDGFGDVYKDEPDMATLQEESAIHAINRIVSESFGQVSLVCLGPLTNIALVIKVYPKIVDAISQIYVMGGNIEGLNELQRAEFNFHMDPESVHVILKNYRKDLWVLPWETCLETKVPFEWRRNIFGRIEKPCVALMNKIEKLPYSSEKNEFEYYVSCDAFLAAAVLRSEVAEKILVRYVDVELNNTKSRGRLNYVKADNRTGKKIFVLRNLNVEIVKEILLFAVDPIKYNIFV
ncbi:inosine-uridine preferring nucleoside hydrolase-like isoform X2 [Prorops nasuta]|uniref:inosine-uridine preferring nucleoside hydrolase-like isoform X2 n=1 Tax=Prorops nasuta TaxID=863751 RepID=UPI0034CEB1DD